MSDPTAHWPATADDAIAELRSAKLRRDLKREGLGNVYVHVARPGAPWPDFPSVTMYGANNSACVLRVAGRDTAEMGCPDLDIRHMCPAELRDLAARLIDVAHDIEANPVHTVQQREAAQAVAA